MYLGSLLKSFCILFMSFWFLLNTLYLKVLKRNLDCPRIIMTACFFLFSWKKFNYSNKLMKALVRNKKVKGSNSSNNRTNRLTRSGLAIEKFLYKQNKASFVNDNWKTFSGSAKVSSCPERADDSCCNISAYVEILVTN